VTTANDYAEDGMNYEEYENDYYDEDFDQNVLSDDQYYDEDDEDDIDEYGDYYDEEDDIPNLPGLLPM